MVDYDSPLFGVSAVEPDAQTLLGGFERKGSVPASLLKQIGPFGILAFKDLTTVLSTCTGRRGDEIIGQLREVADGEDGEVLRQRPAGRVGGQARPGLRE